MYGRWLLILFLIMFLLIGSIVTFIKNKRQDHEAKLEDELSLKDQMLMGTAVIQPELEVKPEEEKSLVEKIYSGKGPQPRYMRYIAGAERKRSIEAAQLAEEKEHQNNIDE